MIETDEDISLHFLVGQQYWVAFRLIPLIFVIHLFELGIISFITGFFFLSLFLQMYQWLHVDNGPPKCFRRPISK